MSGKHWEQVAGEGAGPGTPPSSSIRLLDRYNCVTSPSPWWLPTNMTLPATLLCRCRYTPVFVSARCDCWSLPCLYSSFPVWSWSLTGSHYSFTFHSPVSLPPTNAVLLSPSLPFYLVQGVFFLLAFITFLFSARDNVLPLSSPANLEQSLTVASICWGKTTENTYISVHTCRERGTLFGYTVTAAGTGIFFRVLKLPVPIS